MPRAAAPSFTRVARVRQHFGLRQAELAALLGLSTPQLSRLEAGQQSLTPDISARLAPFLAALPPETAREAAARQLAEVEAEEAGVVGPPPAGAVAAGPLARRRAACLHEARRLRGPLQALARQATVAARWAAALPGLRAALPPPPPAGEAPTTREQVRLRYVHEWLALVPLALGPEALAQYHLGYARLQALEAEAAALGQVLASDMAPAPTT